MTEYAAFLRGVNVGGVNLKMADVAKTFSEAGFDEVRTVLATGNVTLVSRKSADGVRAAAQKALRTAFGYDAWVLVYPRTTLTSIVDGYPFDADADGCHSYVTFVSDPDVLAELAALAEDAPAGEKIARGPASPAVLYWQVAKGKTLDSTIGKTMGRTKYKSSTTTRNLRTLVKTLAAQPSASDSK